MDPRQAGWYPDPELSGQLRWFDGEEWTDQRATPVIVQHFDELRGDVRFIRSVVSFWAFLTVLWIVVAIASFLS